MRRYKVPNTGTLVAFEAAARHESFTRAAQELALTPRQVRRYLAKGYERLHGALEN